MIQLRPHQIAAADAVEQAYREGCRRPLVDSCVGSGKSLMMAELARRAWERGERSIVVAHTRELVEQNANACRALGLQTGINAAALGQRDWRMPVISASIQSVYKSPQNFGQVDNLLNDECHLWPHAESGMYREFARAFPPARAPGFSGTVFRLQGGSLVEGEAPPFERVVYTYGIVDGIRDGYLVPAFSAGAEDKIDISKLRKRQGEYDSKSTDAQVIALMDSHITQMIHHGANRRAWLVFEASVKAAEAMTARLNQWNIPTGCVLGKTGDAERAATIEAFRRGRLRCIVNVAALTTGFDVQEVDLLVMRRPTMSLGLYIQMTGRLLRTIGGNIQASIAAGKSDGLVLDFAGNIDQHGPLDFIQPKQTKLKLVSCEQCKARVPSAAAKCWSCDSPMLKLCPHCLNEVEKGTLDCPHCNFDMRVAQSLDGGSERKPKLLEMPSGAALISSFRPAHERQGGWIPIRKAWEADGVVAVLDSNGNEWWLSDALKEHAPDARWLRTENGQVAALLKPNGANRYSGLQVMTDGRMLPVPMPAVAL